MEKSCTTRRALFAKWLFSRTDMEKYCGMSTKRDVFMDGHGEMLCHVHAKGCFMDRHGEMLGLSTKSEILVYDNEI